MQDPNHNIVSMQNVQGLFKQAAKKNGVFDKMPFKQFYRFISDLYEGGDNSDKEVYSDSDDKLKNHVAKKQKMNSIEKETT